MSSRSYFHSLPSLFFVRVLSLTTPRFPRRIPHGFLVSDRRSTPGFLFCPTACPRCLVPSLAETAWACGHMFIACTRCLTPSLAVSAVGLLFNTLVKRPRCLCPCGATAIRLAYTIIIISSPMMSTPLLAMTAVGLHSLSSVSIDFLPA